MTHPTTRSVAFIFMTLFNVATGLVAMIAETVLQLQVCAVTVLWL